MMSEVVLKGMDRFHQGFPESLRKKIFTSLFLYCLSLIITLMSRRKSLSFFMDILITYFQLVDNLLKCQRAVRSIVYVLWLSGTVNVFSTL